MAGESGETGTTGQTVSLIIYNGVKNKLHLI